MVRSLIIRLRCATFSFVNYSWQFTQPFQFSGSGASNYISAYENDELVGAFSGLVYKFPKTDQPELNVPHSTMKNIILVLEQAEEPLDKYLNEHATPGDKPGS